MGELTKSAGLSDCPCGTCVTLRRLEVCDAALEERLRSLEALVTTQLKQQVERIIGRLVNQNQHLLQDYCVGCGCTDGDACVDPVSGEPCHLVSPNFCSSCADRDALSVRIGGGRQAAPVRRGNMGKVQ